MPPYIRIKQFGDDIFITFPGGFMITHLHVKSGGNLVFQKLLKIKTIQTIDTLYMYNTNW